MRVYSWGTIASGENELKITHKDILDIRDDIGLKYGSMLLELNLIYNINSRNRINLHKITGDIQSKQDKVLEKDFNYDGVSFISGQQVTPEISLNMRNIGYDYSIGNGSLWIGGGIGHYNFNSGFTSIMPPAIPTDYEEQQKITALAPYFHLNSGYKLTHMLTAKYDFKIGLFGLDSILKEPADMSFMDIFGAIRYQPANHIEIEVGLKLLWIKGRFHGTERDNDIADNRLDLRLLAPTIGINLYF